MRKYLIAAVTIAVALTATAAEAKTVWYRGARADAFIAKYLPHASIPGAINQAFVYVSHHRRHEGWASCIVPAMGARSDGAVSVCDVKF